MTNAQRAVFLSATIVYSVYYVCRLSLSVVKVPLIQDGVMTEFQLGLAGSGLFYAYAAGKFANGFLADRANINRFLSVGLLASAGVNLALGFRPGFVVFAALWLVNGWFQSMGAPACVVGLARWFERSKRGTVYGLWSASHNIGEGLTFIAVAVLSTHLGWRWGFWGAAVSGFGAAVVARIWFYNRPEGETVTPAAAEPARAPDATATAEERRRIRAEQWAVVKNPTVWLIAAASAFMYVARYAINSWGVFFLELGKGYTRIEAGTLVSTAAVFGVVGTVASGWVSDRWFAQNRFLPAVLAGLLNALSLAALLATPDGFRWADYAAMTVFGVSIGALICYLGGLLAIDSVRKEAAGAALGIVGIASYIGAGLQDTVSGYLIERYRHGAGDDVRYDFMPVGLFWIGAALASVAISACIWRWARRGRTSEMPHAGSPASSPVSSP